MNDIITRQPLTKMHLPTAAPTRFSQRQHYPGSPYLLFPTLRWIAVARHHTSSHHQFRHNGSKGCSHPWVDVFFVRWFNIDLDGTPDKTSLGSPGIPRNPHTGRKHGARRRSGTRYGSRVRRGYIADDSMLECSSLPRFAPDMKCAISLLLSCIYHGLWIQ